MKSLFTTSFIASSLLLAAAAQAQVTFSAGPRVGLAVSTARYLAVSPTNNLLHTYNAGYRAGLEAGLVGNVGLAHFAVQPAVLYSQRGYTIHDSNLQTLTNEQRDDTYRLRYLTIPVSIAFTQQANGQGVQVAVGGYLGLLLGGSFQGQTTYFSGYYNYGSTPPANRTVTYAGDISAQSLAAMSYSRGTDAGLQGSIGYRYAGALLQIGYSLGLRDLGYKSFYSSTCYNRAFQASLTYLFGPEG